MIKCKCGQVWMKQSNLSGYSGEVVLVCIKCKERYYNAQEWFSEDELSLLQEVVVKDGVQL